MDYLKAVGYLDAETAEGIKPDISRMTNMCRDLGHPEAAFRVIHVTGTNGKTSTARIIRSILSGLGFKTALYSSPHLVSYTERMSIDGDEISEEEFAAVLEHITPAIDDTNRAGLGGIITQFEALTAMAFSWFASRDVDVAVVEVGMGGRWDATNVVKPDVAVITNISLEHIERLGTTIEAITGEKAGIIKYGSTVVTGVDQPSALAIIKEQCSQAGADLKVFGRDFDLQEAEIGLDGLRYLTIKGLRRIYPGVPLALKGFHQAINATIATAAAEAFLNKSPDVETFSFGETLARVLPKADSPGRLETAAKNPLLVLDGAHNPAGAETLAAALRNEFEYDRLILVLAVLEDKDAAGIVRVLGPLANRVITAAAQSPRAMDADSLAGLAEEYADNVSVASSIAEALVQASREARPGDMILATGSLYTVGEAKEALQKKQQRV